MKKLEVRVGGEISGFEATMARVRGLAEHTARHLTSHLGNSLAGMISIGAIEQAIHKTIAWASELTDMSERTGVSVEQLQRLTLAAKENGTSLDALVGFWDRIARARQKALNTPGGSVAGAFGRLGVDATAMKSGSPDDIVRKISAAFQKTENVDELLAPLQQIGGKGAGKMIALLRAGYDQQYQDLQVMSGAQADVLKEMEDKWSHFGQNLLAGFAPVLVAILDAWTWMQDKLVSIFTATTVGWNTAQGKGGENIGKGKQAFFAALKQSEAENKAEREAEDEARKKKVLDRLKFGTPHFEADDEKKKKEHLKAIKELQLDELSKAGLFAGGAGAGMAKNIPERTLEAIEDLGPKLDGIKDALDEGL